MFKKWFNPDHAEDHVAPPEENIGEEDGDRYSAKIEGNAVTGYSYNIYKDGRYAYESVFPVANRMNLESVEEAARKHLATIRKREATKVTKEIK